MLDVDDDGSGDGDENFIKVKILFIPEQGYGNE